MENQEREKYYSLACEALFQFQVLEELLKLCLGCKQEALEGIKHTDKEAKKIYKMTIGQLRQEYKPIDPVGELQKHLNDSSLTKWRNYLAHNALFHARYGLLADNQFGELSIEAMHGVVSTTKQLVSEVNQELVLIKEKNKKHS